LNGIEDQERGDFVMKITPNINVPTRIVYALVGAALVAAPFVMGFGGWERIASPIVGGITLLAGASGW